MRAISATFGPHTDAQWLELSRPMVRPLEGEGGALTLHYDPAIAVPVRATTAEVNMTYTASVAAVASRTAPAVTGSMAAIAVPFMVGQRISQA